MTRFKKSKGPGSDRDSVLAGTVHEDEPRHCRGGSDDNRTPINSLRGPEGVGVASRGVVTDRAEQRDRVAETCNRYCLIGALAARTDGQDTPGHGLPGLGGVVKAHRHSDAEPTRHCDHH